MEQKFSLTFGQEPSSYIDRHQAANQIVSDFTLDYPLSHIYIISGVRGSGKTVLLTKVSNDIKSKKDWIVVDVNPNREILSQVAAGLYESPSVKMLFLSSSFSISFKSFGFTIEGKEPVSNIKTVLEKMLNVVKKHNKKVLITIDEVSNNSFMRSFAHDFQSLLRENYPVFTLMTGLNENVNSIQNNKNLTFLYRSPKIDLKPLDLKLVEKEYKKVFADADEKVIHELTALTKGYAFAYQVIGLLFAKYNCIDKIYKELDDYLAIYIYDKIWEYLPENEKNFMRCFINETTTNNEIIKKTGFSIKEYSVYRDRLIKKGLFIKTAQGEMSLVLPRFNLYIQNRAL